MRGIASIACRVCCVYCVNSVHCVDCVRHCEKSETGGRRERRDLDRVFCVKGTQLLGLSCKEEPFVSYDKGDLLAETGLEAEG